MEMYLLNDTFQREVTIDVFESLIWAERFIKAGDFNLTLPATQGAISAFKPGRFVELKGSEETMMVESSLVEEGQLKVIGYSIEHFFNERYVMLDLVGTSWQIRNKPGLILGTMVNDMAIVGATPLGGTANAIPYLVLGSLDATGVEVNETVPPGPLYDALLKIAETHKVGMAVYLSRADAFGYELTFTTFKGVDRTSGQVQYDPIRFAPAMDSMSDAVELNSQAGFKTVVYLFPPSWTSSTPLKVAYAPGTDPGAVGFARRVLVANADFAASDVGPGGATIDSLMEQKAKDALANNNFTKLVNGEVVPQPGYIYGTHYNLGDTVELVDHGGIVQNARITEYIRSQDASGTREYPTVSIID